MSVKNMKKLVLGSLLILVNSSVFGDVIKFDVLYDTSFRFVCSANSLKVEANQIKVEGFVNCITGSTAEFVKQSPLITAKTLSVTMNGNIQSFSVSKVYGGLDADGFITPPATNANIELVLGSTQIAQNPTQTPVQIDTKNLIIVDPEQTGQTHLPGCAGLVTTDPNLCRGTGSIGNEIFAVKLEEKYLDGFPFKPFNVSGITLDDMGRVDPEFRLFRMAISTVAGDFNPTNPACRQDTGSANITITVMQKQADNMAISQLNTSAQQAVTLALSNPSNITLIDDANRKLYEASAAEQALQNLNDGNICVLEKGQKHYVNIKPENPGCKADINNDGVLDSPNGSCRIEVLSKLPNKAAQ